MLHSVAFPWKEDISSIKYKFCTAIVLFCFEKICFSPSVCNLFSKAVIHSFINCVYSDGQKNTLQTEWICVLKFQNVKPRIYLLERQIVYVLPLSLRILPRFSDINNLLLIIKKLFSILQKENVCVKFCSFLKYEAEGPSFLSGLKRLLCVCIHVCIVPYTFAYIFPSRMHILQAQLYWFLYLYFPEVSSKKQSSFRRRILLLPAVPGSTPRLVS